MTSTFNKTHPSCGTQCLTVTKASGFLIIFSLIAAMLGCSVAPSETTVKKAITDFFESRHYKVVSLKIGKIHGMPLAEKTYMGTPGYVVDVAAVTLEPQVDKGSGIKKGSILAFTNATIRVRQDVVNKNVWHVSIVSGISVP